MRLCVQSPSPEHPSLAFCVVVVGYSAVQMIIGNLTSRATFHLEGKHQVVDCPKPGFVNIHLPSEVRACPAKAAEIVSAYQTHLH